MRRFSSKQVSCMCVGLLVAVFAIGGVLAQEKGDAKSDKKSAGRLPPYYGEVVSKEQREKIYSVQGKYADQLKKLQDQIEALEKQRNEEVEAVLTAEQRDQVAKMAADAKTKKTKKATKTDDKQ